MRARLMHACPRLGHYSAPVDVDLSEVEVAQVIEWWGAGAVVLLDAPIAESEVIAEPEADAEPEAPKPKRRR